MIINPYRFGIVLPPIANMQSVAASCLFDVDATQYVNGQDWKNLVAAPADGSAQTAYDFLLGDTNAVQGVDPVFNGTPGDKAAYWSLNAQYFALKSGVGGPSILQNGGREDIATSWSALAAFKYVAASSQQYFFGNTNGNAAAGWGVFTTNNALRIGRSNGTAADTQNLGATLVDGTDYLLAVTYNSGTRAFKASLNGQTFNLTGTLASAANMNVAASATRFCLGSANRSTSIGMKTPSRLYHVSLFNGILTDAELAAAAALLEGRHLRDYTP